MASSIQPYNTFRNKMLCLLSTLKSKKTPRFKIQKVYPDQYYTTYITHKECPLLKKGNFIKVSLKMSTEDKEGTLNSDIQQSFSLRIFLIDHSPVGLSVQSVYHCVVCVCFFITLSLNCYKHIVIFSFYMEKNTQ